MGHVSEIQLPGNHLPHLWRRLSRSPYGQIDASPTALALNSYLPELTTIFQAVKKVIISLVIGEVFSLSDRV